MSKEMNPGLSHQRELSNALETYSDPHKGPVKDALGGMMCDQNVKSARFREIRPERHDVTRVIYAADSAKPKPAQLADPPINKYAKGLKISPHGDIIDVTSHGNRPVLERLPAPQRLQRTLGRR